ncbi:uncharacterized protein LOC135689612 isoform X2 [Rhopilema esculentum]|uniref:uncharacterized protein LOC135689612 isoform X2 n=1 Tax=Rhopilema esculentum TaxID=499914 RepID=UPI0031D72406
MVRARVGRIGRGRGGRQSRGGRRNGRGRGGLSSNARNPSEASEDSKCLADFEDLDFVGSFDKSVISIFTKQSSFKQHFDAQNSNRERYLAILLVVRSKSVELHDGSKCKALAAAWARRDYQLAQTMLDFPGEQFALKEVLKAVSILDAGRQKRQQEKILRRLEAQGCRKKGKMAKLKSVIASLAQDIPPVGSLSGALIRHIKLWFKTIPTDRLSFFAQHFPREPWKKLADICHLHPENDIPQCPWFLHFVFGKEIPKEDENTPTEIVSDDLTSENISNKVLEFEIDYSVARKFKEHLTDEAKAKICSYAPLNTVIWYFEELRCTEIDGILKRRLESGEKLSLSYGKLMERLQTFMEIKEQEEQGFSTKECRTSTENNAECHNAEALAIPKLLPFIDDLFPIAEEQLGKLKLNIKSPVVVIGDKSSSMQSAIRTSNIIASLLSKVASADLVFFDDYNVIPPFIPTTVEQLCTAIQRILRRSLSC